MPSSYVYRGDRLREVAFPLGGIGTGCVSLEGRGSLRDWEIFNRPNKGSFLELAFPILWCQQEGQASQTRVVQGPPARSFTGGPPRMDFKGDGFGTDRAQGDGLPHFSEAAFTGKFPFAQIRFKHAACPLDVSLEAFSPFIPLDAEASAMPVACLTYQLENRTSARVRATLALTLNNPVGMTTPPTKEEADKSFNDFRQGMNCRGIDFTNERFPAGDHRHGTVALTTDWPDVTVMPNWLRGGAWFDNLHHFWDMFSESGRFDKAPRYTDRGWRHPGSLGLCATLAPGERVEMPILISWCFPTFLKYWGEGDKPDSEKPRWTNAYAKRYPTAWDAAEDFFARRKDLVGRTRAFQKALFGSTLPPAVIESAANTASILRSPTCLQLQDGTFYGWEGCGNGAGCCEGSCTHVWNYALTQAFLFPSLHRTMRRAEYERSFDSDEQGRKGAVVFRLPLPLGTPASGKHAASDGQLGGIVQLYRDWRFSGDDEYLRFMWPHAKRALEFAWHQWDSDRDGVVEGDQHNTYDINFQGPNPLAQCFYLAALAAGAKMARHLGDDTSAAEYERLHRAGREKTRRELFNGEYLVQTLDCLKPDAPKYQHGIGCLSDQAFGQLAAHVGGLGYVLDEDIIKSSLAAVFKHNFRGPLGDHCNLQRIHALADESGLLLCSWPRGGRPKYPFPYSDEVWTGIEYQVASHLIYEGLVEEGLAIAGAVRHRYDGRRRNPYDELECGHHYARALASWGMLLAMSGFRYDAVAKTLHLAPRLPAGSKALRCIFTTGSAWGTFNYDGRTLAIRPVQGDLEIHRVILEGKTVEVDPSRRIARAGKTWKTS
ncbi:MAG: hypothetical protein IT443_02285 [Phycisphaeraceae bacterium]|nr:hypothetical protein [Phycisphaeraceae bacterium]